MEKDQTLIAIKEIAKLKGYELVRKQEKPEEIKDEKISKMTLNELKELLLDADTRTEKINIRNSKLIEEFCVFMNETPSSDFTKSVYSSNNFMSKSVVVKDIELTKLKRLSEYIKKEIKDKTSGSLINGFEAKAPMYKNFIKTLTVRQGSVGDILAVEIEEVVKNVVKDNSNNKNKAE